MINIKETREQIGMSRKELAEIANVSISLIYKLEKGEYNTGNIAARTLLNLADALDIDPHDLLPDEKSDNRGGNFR